MEKIKFGELFCLVWAIINFLIFAYDIENDRDFFTWVWLLASILNFGLWVVLAIHNNLAIVYKRIEDLSKEIKGLKKP